MEIFDPRGAAADDRHQRGISQFVKFTADYPDLALWHRLKLDLMEEPDPTVKVRGEPVTVRLLVRAGRAIDQLYGQYAIRRQLYTIPAMYIRDFVQAQLEQAEEFHQSGKYVQVLNTYCRSHIEGAFDNLDELDRWIVDTIYRVSMEPGQWGGPNVKIAHDLMVDLIEAGGGPRCDASTISRRVRKLDRTGLKIYPVRGFLTRDGDKRATRYQLTMTTGSPSLPSPDLMHTATGGAWLYARSIRGSVDVEQLWKEAADVHRPARHAEPLSITRVPQLSDAQVEAFQRYTVDGVSPSRARRLGGDHERAWTNWYIDHGMPGWGELPPELCTPAPEAVEEATPTHEELVQVAVLPDVCPRCGSDDLMHLLGASGGWVPVCMSCLVRDSADDAATWVPIPVVERRHPG